MRRSLASQYRVKTAHHLLNILALNREIDTYNVNGLLKAASVGQSKEACLRYAGLHAALLIEKRAIDFNNLFKAADDETPIPRGGYNSPYFGGSGSYGARPNPIPGLNSTGPGTAPAPGVQGGGVPMGLGGKASLKQQPAPTPPAGPGFFSRMGSSFSNGLSQIGGAIANTYDNTTTGLANGLMGAGDMASNAAGATTDYLSGGPRLIGDTYRGVRDTVRSFPYGTGESKPVPNVHSMNVPQQENRIAKAQVENDAAQKLKKWEADKQVESNSGVPSFVDNERVPSNFGGDPAVTAAKAVAKTPARPTPASVIPKPAATGGADPFAANSAAYAKAQRAAKPSYTEDPVEAAYSKKLNQGAAQSAGRQQATNIASDVGNFMSNAGRTAANAVNGASKAMGGSTPPSTGGYAASQSGYGVSPAAKPAPAAAPASAQSDYDSQIAESQRYSDASKQQGDEDAYMKSIEPTAPTYKASPPAESSPVAQEEVARELQPQAPQGRRTPVRNILGKIRGK